MPINEETTFTDHHQQQQQEAQQQPSTIEQEDNSTEEPQVKQNAMQSWSEGLNEAEGRKVEDPTIKTRGQSVPFSPKLFSKNRVTPLPTATETSDSEQPTAEQVEGE